VSIKFKEVEVSNMRDNHVRGFQVVKYRYVSKRKNRRIFATFSHEITKKCPEIRQIPPHRSAEFTSTKISYVITAVSAAGLCKCSLAAKLTQTISLLTNVSTIVATLWLHLFDLQLPVVLDK